MIISILFFLATLNTQVAKTVLDETIPFHFYIENLYQDF